MEFDGTVNDRNKFFYTLIYKMGVSLTAVDDATFTMVEENYMSTEKIHGTKMVRLPFYGEFVFVFESRAINVSIESDTTTTTSHITCSDYIQRKMRVIFRADVEDLKRLFQQVHQIQSGSDESAKVYVNQEYGWKQKGTLRADLSCLFYDGIDILHSIDSFLSKRERYIRFNRDFKRMYLLTGPPGTGKTSMIRAVAHHYKRDLYVFNMGDPNIQKTFISLISEIPSSSIVAFEDLDRFFMDSDNTKDTVNLSMLLNVIDGTLSSSLGTISFITANHPDRLPEALTRSGRVDEVINFDGAVSFAQFDKACRVVAEIEEPERALYEIVRVQRLTMADLMEVLFSGDTPEQRLAIARKLGTSRKFLSGVTSMFM